LWFDGGPFGYGHQHEDKLEIIVTAYGRRFLVDPGNYTYEHSKWRSYFIDSPSHNVVLVDGEPQRRRGRPRGEYVVKEPLPHVWESKPAYDYVEASYDEDFAEPVKRNVSESRALLFIKPDLWVVLDTLTAKDGKEHNYDTLFHFDGKVAADGLRLATHDADEPNLTIVARPDAGLKLRVVEGQEDPVQGWLPQGLSSVRPAPVGIYTAHGGTTSLLYVLAPSPKGAGERVKSVGAGADAESALITLTNGKVYNVHFHPGRTPEW
jgi:hypothetical protein